ncbi:MAG: carotenoid biosynthesis protein [Syntrophaceae bacterium]
MKKESSNTINPSFVEADKKFDRKFAFISYGILILMIVFFTYLHHFRPDVLQVPDNSNVSSWKNPSFEQTNIYDRMTEAEKQKIRAEGIPGHHWTEVLFDLQGDVLAFVFSLLCFIHARRHYGFWMASCFLIGSFVFTGLQESIAILLGRFTAGQAYTTAEQVTHGTYFFTKGLLWFIETPVAVCLSWFWIAYACVFTAGKVFPKMGVAGRAIIGGLTAMIIDLWLDPVATSPEFMMWLWAKGDLIRILGINHSNFVGWFLLIFLFAILWECLPPLVRMWGRLKASIAFFAIVLLTDVFMLIILIIHNTFLIRGLLKLFGVNELQIPPGW